MFNLVIYDRLDINTSVCPASLESRLGIDHFGLRASDLATTVRELCKKGVPDT